MTLYFQIPDAQTVGTGGFLKTADEGGPNASHMAQVTTQKPDLPEKPPSPWLCHKDGQSSFNLIHLDQPDGRERFATLMTEIPIYRITLELLVDRMLLDSRDDAVRMKGVRAAFLPDEPPEMVSDPVGEKYAFEGTLHFPVIASRTDVQLLELYLKLYGPACPAHESPADHVAAMLGGYPARFSQNFDGILWRGEGWVRFDHLVYDAERLDHDPGITFESYVTRGREAAESLLTADAQALLAAWIAAERVQRDLCRDIDAALRLPNIRRLPRWVRADVFRILEREAMKQVFAEGLVKSFSDWPALRRTTSLAVPIEANAKGEVAPLIQQLLNQTLSADARYSGSGEAFSIQAQRRWGDANSLLAHA